MKKQLSIFMTLAIVILTFCLSMSKERNKTDGASSISLCNEKLWESIDKKISSALAENNELHLMSCSYGTVHLVDCETEMAFLDKNYDVLQTILTNDEFIELETAINNKTQYLEDGILCEDEDGDLFVNEDSNYQLQSTGISIKNVQKKIWKFKLPIGFDVSFGSSSWAYSFLTIAAFVDLISTITEISFIWMGGISETYAIKLGLDVKAVNEARVILNSLASYFVGLKDLSNSIAGLLINGTIPTAVFSLLDIAFGAILSLVKSGGVVGILITTILHIITPSVGQCFKIIKSCAEQNKLPILHYTLIKYDSYSLV